jgi:lipopolysaccharide biosynthesis regulator YciM
MKIKTALLIAGFSLLTVLLIIFELNNHELLVQQFTVFGISFSVIRALVGSMLLSSLIPLLAMTYSYGSWFRQHHATKKELKHHQSHLPTWAGTLHQDFLTQPLRNAQITTLFLQDSDPVRQWLAGELLLRQGCADTVHIPALKDHDFLPLRALYARAAEALGQVEESRLLMKQLWQQSGSQNLDAAHFLFRISLQQNQTAEALTYAQVLHRAGVLGPQPLRHLSFQQLKEESVDLPPKKRLARLSDFAKDHPQFFPVQAERLESLLQQELPEKAETLAKTLYAEYPEVALLWRIADFYIQNNQPERAIQFMKQTAVETQDLKIQWAFACLMLHLEMIDEGLEAALPLLDRWEEGCSPWQLLLGVAHGHDRTRATHEIITKLSKKGLPALREWHCSACGATAKHWMNPCPHCHAWETYQSSIATPKQS